MSEATIDYILIPLAGCLAGYAILLTIVLLAAGNGWLRKWK